MGHGYAVFGKVIKGMDVVGQNSRRAHGQPRHAPECAHHCGDDFVGHRSQQVQSINADSCAALPTSQTSQESKDMSNPQVELHVTINVAETATPA